MKSDQNVIKLCKKFINFLDVFAAPQKNISSKVYEILAESKIKNAFWILFWTNHNSAFNDYQMRRLPYKSIKDIYQLLSCWPWTKFLHLDFAVFRNLIYIEILYLIRSIILLQFYFWAEHYLILFPEKSISTFSLKVQRIQNVS